MITAALVATLTVAATPAEPEDLVLVRVEPTRLVARNLGREERLLFFADEDRLQVVGHRLRAGESLRLEYPRHALDGVSLEVVDAAGAEWSTTGALPLATHPTSRAWSLYCTPPRVESQRHGLAGGAREALTPTDSLLPAKALRFFRDEPAAAAREALSPTHVPGPKPGPPKPGDTPPDLEKDPLPPL